MFALFAIWASLLAYSALTGGDAIWNFEPRNLAEAVAAGDGAAVIRRVDAGEDINQRVEVREQILRADSASLTPIEVAALSGEREMTELVLELGARPDPGTWLRAFCDAGSDDVRELLAAQRPAGAADECAAR